MTTVLQVGRVCLVVFLVVGTLVRPTPAVTSAPRPSVGTVRVPTPSIQPLRAVDATPDLRAVFDAQDAAVNGGWGYSREAANRGYPTGHLLAWSEAYLQSA